MIRIVSWLQMIGIGEEVLIFVTFIVNFFLMFTVKNAYVLNGDLPGKYNIRTDDSMFYPNVKIFGNATNLEKPIDLNGKRVSLATWTVKNRSKFAFFPGVGEATDILKNKILMNSSDVCKEDFKITTKYIVTEESGTYLILKVDLKTCYKEIFIEDMSIIDSYKNLKEGDEFIFYDLLKKEDLRDNYGIKLSTKLIPYKNMKLPKLITIEDYLMNRQGDNYLMDNNLCVYGIVSEITGYGIYNENRSRISITLSGENDCSLDINIYYPNNLEIDRYVLRFELLFVFSLSEKKGNYINTDIKDVYTL